MKILVIGDFNSDIHEEALYRAFSELGHKAMKFAFCEYFKGYLALDRGICEGNVIRSLYYRAQNKTALGPTINKINKDIIKLCESTKPDLAFFYRSRLIFPETVRKIKYACGRVAGYNNDDPFSAHYPRYIWRNFMDSIQYYDHIFAYRNKNILDYRSIGYRNVSLLKPYFIKEKNFPVDILPDSCHASDVSFIGHFEDDGRDDHLMAILEKGINLKLYGPGWRSSKNYRFFANNLGGIIPLRSEYNLAINSSKIALSFLSKLNNDSYTRRCFEIIAAKKFMLSEYSRDLDDMFKEGLEAEYFRDKKEMLDKIRFYLKNETARRRIEEAGYKRIMLDGHEVMDRAKEVIAVLRSLYAANEKT